MTPNVMNAMFANVMKYANANKNVVPNRGFKLQSNQPYQENNNIVASHTRIPTVLMFA
jgi:hypothetical protein